VHLSGYFEPHNTIDQGIDLDELEDDEDGMELDDDEEGEDETQEMLNTKKALKALANGKEEKAASGK